MDIETHYKHTNMFDNINEIIFAAKTLILSMIRCESKIHAWCFYRQINVCYLGGDMGRRCKLTHDK